MHRSFVARQGDRGPVDEGDAGIDLTPSSMRLDPERTAAVAAVDQTVADDPPDEDSPAVGAGERGNTHLRFLNPRVVGREVRSTAPFSGDDLQRQQSRSELESMRRPAKLTLQPRRTRWPRRRLTAGFVAPVGRARSIREKFYI